MDRNFKEVVRESLTIGVYLLTDDQKALFRKMYGHGMGDATFEEIIARIPGDKLDWALRQVVRTIARNLKH